MKLTKKGRLVWQLPREQHRRRGDLVSTISHSRSKSDDATSRNEEHQEQLKQHHQRAAPRLQRGVRRLAAEAHQQLEEPRVGVSARKKMRVNDATDPLKRRHHRGARRVEPARKSHASDSGFARLVTVAIAWTKATGISRTGRAA